MPRHGPRGAGTRVPLVGAAAGRPEVAEGVTPRSGKNCTLRAGGGAWPKTLAVNLAGTQRFRRFWARSEGWPKTLVFGHPRELLTGCSRKSKTRSEYDFRPGSRAWRAIFPVPRRDPISHESLVRQWSRLRAWAAAKADSEKVARYFSESADLWDSKGRDPGFLLPDDVRLVAVTEWREQSADELSPMQQARNLGAFSS